MTDQKENLTDSTAISSNGVLTDVSNRIDEQRAEQTQINIKRLIQGAKVIDLSILDEIASENDAASMFDMSDNSYRISQSLAAVKEFCTASRNIRERIGN